MSNFQQDFAKLLRSRRVELDLLQDDVAAAMGIHRATYSNYELGNTQPELSNLRLLMDALKLPIEAFVFPERYLPEAPRMRLRKLKKGETRHKIGQ